MVARAARSSNSRPDYSSSSNITSFCCWIHSSGSGQDRETAGQANLPLSITINNARDTAAKSPFVPCGTRDKRGQGARQEPTRRDGSSIPGRSRGKIPGGVLGHWDHARNKGECHRHGLTINHPPGRRIGKLLDTSESEDKY